MPNDVFLEDLATKLNNMHNQKLVMNNLIFSMGINFLVL